ncbi:MAG: helicase-exonuclease AddAB subunit AddB [Lachnospiraceae bacterium]|nr:helicase-exonuclease AddAB subunit AddB [Lachnospiraceae bacterium]
MGLRFYIGASGSGKSYQLYNHIIRESMANPHVNYLIVVPDQFTMQTQLEMVRKHPNKGIMNIDVLSFGRLSHRIFEEVGGNDKPVLDDTGKSLVLRRVAARVEDELGVMKRNIRKPGYISEVKSALSEFMQYGLGTKDVEKLCEYAAKRNALAYKLKDLHLLYENFLNYINERYITTEETLDLLRKVLSRSRVVKGSVIVFDGFTGFTPVQYNVIQELMVQAQEVIVTVTMDAREDAYVQDGEQKLFHLSKKTIHDLDRLCREAGVKREKDERIADEVVYRYKSNAGLSHLERELFRYPYHEFKGAQDSIQIFEASNPKEELRQVCLEIRRLVREKDYCYRDIAVVTGDLERYGFLAREMFRRFEIPFFVDQTNKLVLNPFIEFIRSALLVVIQEYSYEAVFHFLRCGMAGVTPDETDRLENYCLTMGIRGKKAWNSKFTRRMKRQEEEAPELEALNAVREKVTAMLEPLMIKKAEKKATGKELVCALYAFIVNASIEEKLVEYEQYFTEQGDLVKAKEYAQIYRLVMELLEQICGLLGEEELEIKEFADILDAGFAEIKVGTIPQNVDKVVIGDIERTRLCEIKALFFIGVNDGIIPKSGGTGGIISDIDREFLQESEYELAPTPRQQMYIQRLYLYLMMTKPTELLYLSYAKVDNEGKSIRPAYLINTVIRLFPAIVITQPQLRSMEEQIESPADTLAYLVTLLRRYAADDIGDERRLFITLYDTYVRNEKYAPVLEQMKKAAFSYLSNADTNRLPRELARLLYGQILRNSISRLEKFASCAYAHFLQYGLRLEERDKYSFESVDMGNLFHAVLESFSDKIVKEGYTWFDFPREVGERIVGECLEDYAVSYGETILYSSKRNEYMITRMRRILNRTVQTLQHQIQKGSFTPENFELSFQMTSDLNAVNISLSEEERLQLIGRIDRIDTCQKEDKLYVKIIDYKSGNQKFDLAALYYGLQLQLVVYMNAAVEVLKKKNQEKNTDMRVIPAAMLYYHVSDPMTETDKGKPDASEIEEAILEELKMTGMVSDDEEVIKLLDKDFETKSTIIPVARKKDGSFTQTSSVLSDEDFKTVSDYVNHKIKELGVSILDGDIGLSPYEQKDANACTYCDYKGVCGFDKKLGSRLVRHLEDLNQDDAMERMRQSLGLDEEEEDQTEEEGGEQ